MEESTYSKETQVGVHKQVCEDVQRQNGKPDS